MASAIALFAAPVTAAAGYTNSILPKAFLRKGRQRFAAPRQLLAQF
jgi:hypothetical protein